MKLMKIILMISITCFSSAAFSCPTCLGEKENTKIGFMATSAISFNKLMEESMHLMDTKMSEVEMKGTPEKIFLKMMLAHHEGAINMAHSLLAHSKDKEMTNFARSIISNQTNEVLYIQAKLKSLK